MSSCLDRSGVVLARRRSVAAWMGLVMLLALVGALTLAPPTAQAQSPAGVQNPAAAYAGIGRPATPKEIQAWDIDVRPDFKGLPAGAGTVAKGMEVWEAKCASCHGVFGENNEVFTPIVGGTTREDIKTGRVARLTDGSFPGRTTLMKVASLSTLWDYVNRAMPWNAPKSLSVEEVYAATAYMLNLGGVLPDNFTLSDKNMAEVQKLLPNRNGMTTDHALWPGPQFGAARPDVAAQACMSNCSTEAAVASFLPDFARNAHGNLAEQNRAVGAQRGADTTRPAGANITRPAGAGVASVGTAAATAALATKPTVDASATAAFALAQKHTCTACHGLENRIVGPSFREIAKKYAGTADAFAYLAGKVKGGGAGVWGAIPMPAQALSEADAKVIAQWLSAGAAK